MNNLHKIKKQKVERRKKMSKIQPENRNLKTTSILLTQISPLTLLVLVQALE